MKIKLFEEHNELNFSDFNKLSYHEYHNLLESNEWLILNNYELNKIKSLIDIKQLGSIKIWYKTSNFIEIVKIQDDYYLIDFFYKLNKIYIKCDQLSELLKLIKIIK